MLRKTFFRTIAKSVKTFTVAGRDWIQQMGIYGQPEYLRGSVDGKLLRRDIEHQGTFAEGRPECSDIRGAEFEEFDQIDMYVVRL